MIRTYVDQIVGSCCICLAINRLSISQVKEDTDRNILVNFLQAVIYLALVANI